MKLDQFIKQSLVSIITGIKDANQEAFDKKLHKYADGPFNIEGFGPKQDDAHYINFDIAVTTTSEVSGSTTGSGNIMVASLESNLEGKKSSENVSRIKFKVVCKHL